MLKIK